MRVPTVSPSWLLPSPAQKTRRTYLCTRGVSIARPAGPTSTRPLKIPSLYNTISSKNLNKDIEKRERE
ncbi:hypothetical protein CMV_006248 [Castanea mollissima]|uniref:Uncharacterized protein n=1 Tax=Castanea mollissima TaxID=60419 RepID=A0A8J4VTS0_9ROSI|nr:hypothetical protein CMV_006248 [Castanea mollissima]